LNILKNITLLLSIELFTSNSLFGGDIEQILPSGSTFTIDGDSGIEVMRAQSDGKVGIGTTTPNEKLEVNGHIRMTDGNQADNTIMIGNADGTASWANISIIKDNNSTDDQVLSSSIGTAKKTIILNLENGGSTTINIEDGDADDTNELLISAELNGTTLLLTDEVGTLSVDLSSLNNTGSDNQQITDFSLNKNILTLTIENGGTKTVDLSDFNSSYSLQAVQALQAALAAHIADTNTSINELNNSIGSNATAINDVNTSLQAHILEDED